MQAEDPVPLSRQRVPHPIGQQACVPRRSQGLRHRDVAAARCEPIGLVGVGDDGQRAGVAGVDPAARHELADGAQLPRELPHPRLASVAPDHFQDRRIRDLDWSRLQRVHRRTRLGPRCGRRLPGEHLHRRPADGRGTGRRLRPRPMRHRRGPGPEAGGGQPGSIELVGPQGSPCDVDLLLLRVPGRRDHLEPVPQRRGDCRQVVGGRDEQDLGEVEGDIQVDVPEAGVLLGVEELEQGRRRVAVIVRTAADLVDLVEDDDGVADPGLLKRLYDPARLGRPERGRQSADGGLVPDAAQGHEHRGAAQGPGDQLGE